MPALIRGAASHSTAKKILTSTGWLSRQPPEFQSRFLGHGEVVAFGPDEFILQVGDQPGGVFGIIEGAVGVSLPAEEAGLRLAHIVRAGTWFGYGPLFTGGRRTLTFRTTEPTTLIKIELARLNDVGRDNLAFTRIMATINVETATIAAEIIHDLLIPQTDRRISATLLRVAGVNKHSRSSKIREIRLNQVELAEMANTSRHSVNRTLRLFQKTGWIGVSYRHIQIYKPVALARFAIGENSAISAAPTR